MAQPDHRDTRRISGFAGGADPDDPGTEEYYSHVSGYRKAWSVRADVVSEFASDIPTTTTHRVLAEVESEFKSRSEA